MIKLTDHFSVEEFSCSFQGKPCPFCGGAVLVNSELVHLANILEILRDKLSKNFDEEVFIYVISGHRCFERNKSVSTCVPHFWSKHIKVAADIIVKYDRRLKIVPHKVVYGYADKIFRPGGVGLYSGHVHIDLRKEVARW